MPYLKTGSKFFDEIVWTRRNDFTVFLRNSRNFIGRFAIESIRKSFQAPFFEAIPVRLYDQV